MKEVVIVSAVRSAVGRGKQDGSLASVHAADLSAELMRAAIDAAKLDPATIDDVHLGVRHARGDAGAQRRAPRLASRRAPGRAFRRRRSTASAPRDFKPSPSARRRS